MIYLPCAFSIMLFLMSLIFQVLGYWVSGGEDIIELIQKNLSLYFKMGTIGFVIGFVMWIFNIN